MLLYSVYLLWIQHVSAKIAIIRSQPHYMLKLC